MSTKKDRDHMLATAVTGIGVGAIFGQLINHIISKDTSFLMRVGTCIGGAVLGLMTADKAIEWVETKIYTEDQEESESAE